MADLPCLQWLPESETTTASVTAPDQQIAHHEADDRAAMLASVDALLAQDDDGPPPAVDDTPKRGEDGKFLPKAGTAAAKPVVESAPAEDEPKSKLALAIRAREEARKTVDTAKTDAEALISTARQRAEAEADKIIAEARRRGEEERNAWRQRFKDAPTAAIKEHGETTVKRLVEDVTNEGSPEWQARKEMRDEIAAAKAELKELRDWRDSQKKEQESFNQQRVTQARRDTEARFVALIPEGSALKVLYDSDEILAKAHSMADVYREKTGEVAQLEDLRDYLEEQAAKKLASIRQEKAGVPATKTKANGPRTPSSLNASERRTSPKPYAELSPEEARDAMKQAAEDAMSANAKT